MDRSSLIGLGKQLKRAGLRVKKVKGWESRGSSDFAPRAVVFHHTASGKNSGNAPCVGLVTRGTSVVPGPLCNLLIARNGDVFLIAARRANHAGLGGPLRGIPENSANKYAVGVECENDGRGEPWPRKQLDAIDLAFAVTLRFLNRRPHRVFGHKEWTTRKIDPANIVMSRVRRRVARALRVLRRKRR